MKENTKWICKLKKNPIDWLIESNPWTKYRTLTDLLEYPADSQEVIIAHKELTGHKQIRQLITETSDWMPSAATRNSDPQLSYFKLRMLSDFGITHKDKGISEIQKKAVKHKLDSLFACRGQIPERLNKGEKYVKPELHANIWHISPCNSPMITYSLSSLGFSSKELDASVEKLKGLWETKTGWFCHFFFVNSQFKKVNAGCPMAGLMALEVFSLFPEPEESSYVKNAFSTLQFHKEYGQTLYYFGRSKKFWTFKYPYVWYNGLYLADVLSRFRFFRKSQILEECIAWILSSQDADGRFKPTSIFLHYKDFDFGNKKEVSPWITFLCCRILKRYFE